MVQIGAFNPAEVTDNTLLPTGTYKLAVTKTSMKPSSNNPNNLVFTLESDVQEGEHQGRKIFTNLNLVSDNQQAKDIAQRELKRIVEACNLTSIKADLDELLGIPFMAEVGVEVSKNPQYQDKNRITKCYPVSGATAPQAAPTKGPWAK